jgi:hypothetical protein
MWNLNLKKRWSHRKVERALFERKKGASEGVRGTKYIISSEYDQSTLHSFMKMSQ